MKKILVFLFAVMMFASCGITASQCNGIGTGRSKNDTVAEGKAFTKACIEIAHEQFTDVDNKSTLESWESETGKTGETYHEITTVHSAARITEGRINKNTHKEGNSWKSTVTVSGNVTDPE